MVGLTAVPTRLLLQPCRMAIADGQRQLNQAQAESSTGRRADPGLMLGSQTGDVITLRTEITSLSQSKAAGEQAMIAAGLTQDALSALNSVAERFRSDLTGARSAGNGPSISASIALSSLGALDDKLIATHDGNFLFGGLASGSRPLNRYEDGPRQAIRDSFVTTFGFPPEDPAAANLSSDQVLDYIGGAFKSLFTDPGWSSVWSNASAETGKLRLGYDSSVIVSSTAHAPFARKLAEAFALVELVGSSKINAAAFSAATEKALVLSSEAQAEIASEQTGIGVGQSRVREIMLTMERRRETLSSAVSALEGVDPYEAATRVNLLMTQLEASYALTGRISRMNLLSYL